MADLSELLMADEATTQERLTALRNSLARDKAFGMAAALSGNRPLGGVGNYLMQGSSSGEEQLSRFPGERQQMTLRQEQINRANEYNAGRAHPATRSALKKTLERFGVSGKEYEDAPVGVMETILPMAEKAWAAEEANKARLAAAQLRADALREAAAQRAHEKELKGVTEKAITEPQGRAADTVTRIGGAVPAMQEAGVPKGLRGRLDEAATGTNPNFLSKVVPQELASKKGQQYAAAAREVATALLRKESGAAITPDEWSNIAPLFIPMSYDNPITKRDKLTRLRNRVEAMAVQAGPVEGPKLLARFAPSFNALSEMAVQQGAKGSPTGTAADQFSAPAPAAPAPGPAGPSPQQRADSYY